MEVYRTCFFAYFKHLLAFVIYKDSDTHVIINDYFDVFRVLKCSNMSLKYAQRSIRIKYLTLIYCGIKKHWPL